MQCGLPSRASTHASGSEPLVNAAVPEADPHRPGNGVPPILAPATSTKEAVQPPIESTVLYVDHLVAVGDEQTVVGEFVAQVDRRPIEPADDPKRRADPDQPRVVRWLGRLCRSRRTRWCGRARRA
jgi:hypothetical protein